MDAVSLPLVVGDLETAYRQLATGGEVGLPAKTTAFRDQTSSSTLPAVPCIKQPAQPSLGQIVEMSDYTHVYANP